MDRRKVFIVCNQGLHPIKPLLKKQYLAADNDIQIVTEGNVDLSMHFAEYFAKKVKDIIFDNTNSDIYIVWSGMPIYNAVAYNVAREVINRDPILLIWNRDTNLYEEFNINARKLVFGK